MCRVFARANVCFKKFSPPYQIVEYKHLHTSAHKQISSGEMMLPGGRDAKGEDEQEHFVAFSL